VTTRTARASFFTDCGTSAGWSNRIPDQQAISAAECNILAGPDSIERPGRRVDDSVDGQPRKSEKFEGFAVTGNVRGDFRGRPQRMVKATLRMLRYSMGGST
jgi:hypothetical protein